MAKWIDPKKLAEGYYIARRNKDIAKRYKSGWTMAKVGLMYAISRERVRQILSSLRINTVDGGIRLQTNQRRANAVSKRLALREARILKRYGCTSAEYDSIMKGKPFIIDNECKAYVYYHYKANWKRVSGQPIMSFTQWNKIWTASGKYAKRGIHKGQYVMARKNNIGPWMPGNVRIILSSDNISNMSTMIRTGHDDKHCKHGHILKNNVYYELGYARCKECARRCCAKSRLKRLRDGGKL